MEATEEDLIKIHELALEERTNTVRGLLNSNKLPEALAESLRKPPTGFLGREDIKIASADVVGEVLDAIKDADIAKSIQNLTPDQVDSLMKYLYRGLATCNKSNTYLKWHEAVYKRGGHGCIIRCLAERKTVVDTR